MSKIGQPLVDKVIKVMVHVPYEITFRGESGKQEAIKALERETPWLQVSPSGFVVKQLGGNTVHE